MVCFDVVSLFTSIPLDLAKQYKEDLLKSCDTDVPAIALLELLDLCMETNFSFDQKYYQQLKGAPMGSPISSFLAEITMQKLEATALPLVNPKLWLRYVDDTFVIVKKDQLDTLHNTINSTMPGIKFTLEKEVDKELPFLDVLVQWKTDGTLRTSVNRKETYPEVILHYESNHPISHKRSAVNCLLNRAKTHCSDEEGNRAELSRSLGTRIKEHKLAVRRRDPLSLVFAHALECDHRFNWDGTEVVAMANTKRARELLEAWYSNAGSINRHVDLDAHYEGLRSRLTAPCPNHASTTANTEARSPTDSPPTLPLQHSVP
ncbi:hypothetical protein SprV_0602093500 [Sparganum proliferum]